MQQRSGKCTKKTKNDVKLNFKVDRILKLGWKVEGKTYSCCASGFVRETIRTSMKLPQNFQTQAAARRAVIKRRVLPQYKLGFSI